MRAHVVHALYSSFFFCNTHLIWLCMKAVAKASGCVLLPDSEWRNVRVTILYQELLGMDSIIVLDELYLLLINIFALM